MGYAIQRPWKKLNQASVTTAKGYTSAVTTPVLALAKAMAEGDAAQNPANWPSAIAAKLDQETCAVRLRFALSDANNEQSIGTLWGRDGNGGAIPLAVFSNIQAGQATVTADPVDGTTLTNFAYADTLAESGGIGATRCYSFTDGIGEAVVLTRGVTELFMDFDCDGVGTASADAIAWYKPLSQQELDMFLNVNADIGDIHLLTTSNVKINPATEDTLSSLNGKVTACNTGAVVVSSSALPTGAATSAAQASLLAAVQSPVDFNTATVTIAQTGVAQVLLAGVASCSGFHVWAQSEAANAANVLIGDALSQVYPIEPSNYAGVSIKTSTSMDASTWMCKGTAGDKLHLFVFDKVEAV